MSGKTNLTAANAKPGDWRAWVNIMPGFYTLHIVAISCAISWSVAEAAVMWPSFPSGALLMNILTRGVTFTIIARVIAKLWKQKESGQKDALTGVANRQELSSRLEDIQLKSKVSGNPYSLLYINIDGFRRFNSVSGHQNGDEVLKQLANTLSEVTKSHDVVSRIASDEFFIILTETDENLIKQLAFQFCRAAEKNFIQNGWKLTLSYGYTTEIGTQKSLEELIRLAGRHLQLNRNSTEK